MQARFTTSLPTVPVAPVTKILFPLFINILLMGIYLALVRLTLHNSDIDFMNKL